MNRSAADTAIRSGLESFLSDQLNEKVTISRLTRPTATGFSADTMIVDLMVGEGGSGGSTRPDRVVVQAAPTGPSLFEAYDLARSFAVQRELAGFDVPVAPMRWLCEDRSWIGTPFYVMDHVEGLVPPDRPPYHVEGWLFDLPLADRAGIWMAGIEAMGSLHDVPISSFSFLNDDQGTDTADDQNTNMARQRIEHWRSFGHDLGPDVEPALMRALDKLESVRPQCGPLRVSWGDAKLGNMIFNDGRAAAILDWELTGLSVGEEDLAHWMAVDWFLSTGIGLERLPGLPGPGSTIARYESIVGRRVVGVEWWFVFAVVRMGLIFQRAAVQSRRRRGGEGPLRANAVAPHLAQLLDGTVWADYRRRNDDEVEV